MDKQKGKEKVIKTIELGKTYKKTIVSVVFILSVVILALTGVIEPSKIMSFFKLVLGN